ncbi:helix-turn-helix domain-containing protein [Tardiphaga sp. vice278]|uniref:helix-turn-helix domain-containing protein n=1 Tax=Tardiphaga sp. vice278 TaxID=2592815 RepID=UPI003F9366BC
MRQVREIIRLKFSAGVSTREIARRLGIAASTVRETLRRFEGAELGWPLPDGMSDGDLEAALYANYGTKRGHRRHAEPDWLTVHRELKRKHVTLVIVWDEYIAANPGGYSYSQFCELYRGFESNLSPTMRQTHAAGERLFVDYAGDGVPVVIDRLTGALLDRLTHHVHILEMNGDSFRLADSRRRTRRARPEPPADATPQE